MSLTDTAIRAAKPRRKAYKLADGGGMYLLVHPNGSRYWRMDYRFLGKRKSLALGLYPQVSLGEARSAREAAKKQLANGEDPSAQRKLQKITGRISAENSFRAVGEEWLAKCEREGRAEITLTKNRWLLAFAFPLIGDQPIAEISAPEVLAVLRTVEVRGKHETARRLRSTCSAVFRYAIATGRAEQDPTIALRGALTAPQVTHRAAITDPKAVGALLRAIEGFEGQPITHACLTLAPHVFLRPGELRTAEWIEIDFDNAIWTIPARKTKMRRPHRVPLSSQVIEILNGAKAFSGNGLLVFPSIRTVKRPLSENTINASLRRLGYDKTEMTGHGFRAMASSILNESGLWNPDAIERQLAHVDDNNVRRAYARAEFWDERVRMMQWWSDKLDELQSAMQKN